MNGDFDSKMVIKVSECNTRNSDNKVVDSHSNPKSPPSQSSSSPVTSQGALAQGHSKQVVLLPQNRVTYNKASGWTSVPNSPPSKRHSYSRDNHHANNSNTGSSWMYDCESDSEFSDNMESVNSTGSYFGYGKNLQRSQSNISEKSYSYLPDSSMNVPQSAYASPYPYSSMGSPLSVCSTASTSSIPSSSMGNMDIYYPPFSVSSAFPIPSSGYSPVCQNYYEPYWLCYGCRKPKM